MHSISSPRSRALAVVGTVLVAALLAAACGGDGDESAEADATTTTTTTSTTEAPSEAPTSTAPDSSAPEEFPTIDVEAALQGIDTETEPDPRFCEISGFVNGAEFQTIYLLALEDNEDAQAQIEELFDEFEEVAPEDLKADVVALEAGLVLAIEATVEAIESDGMVDRTQLQEDIAAIVGDSGARLGAYDQIVCGNAVPGEPLS